MFLFSIFLIYKALRGNQGRGEEEKNKPIFRLAVIVEPL